MLNGMLWVARSEAQWRELPEAYGPWQSVYARFAKWRDSGVLEAIFRALSQDADVENLVAPRIKENPPKRDSYRTIPVNNECVAFLDSHPHNGTYIFPNPDSSPQSPNSRSHKLKRFMREMHAKDLSIPILSPHLASDGA